MTHVRQTIRDTLVTTLTGLPLTGSNVFAARVYPLRTDQLPAILIYTKTEEVEALNIGRPISMMRTLKVGIDVYVSDISSADDTIDDVAADVEAAIGVDPTLSGLTKDAMLTDVEIEHVTEGEVPFYAARMNYDIEYVTAQDDSETAL